MQNMKAKTLFKISWAGAIVLLLASALWLPFSHLALRGGENFLQLVAFNMVGWTPCQLIAYQLRNDSTPLGSRVRGIAARFALAFQALTFVSVLIIGAMIFSHLAVAAALPLQDAAFAAFDQAVGFDWIVLLKYLNSYSWLSRAVSLIYWSSALQLLFVFLLLSAMLERERLAEAQAILSVSTVIVCVVGYAFPAAGAIPFYQPAAENLTNFNSLSGMWHYEQFMYLRTSPAPLLDFSKPAGVIQFPSLHVVIAIVTVFALRGIRALFWPALLINLVVILGTLPEGGHHLADSLAGGVIAFAVIFALNRAGLLAGDRANTYAIGRVVS
jgi:membrane-associated phospholipid phosphatase